MERESLERKLNNEVDRKANREVDCESSKRNLSNEVDKESKERSGIWKFGEKFE